MTPSAPDRESVTAWLNEWQSLIRARDFDNARALFQEDVVGFGTAVEMASGLEELVNFQWGVTWPHIDGFTFDLDRGRIETADGGALAWVATPWHSKGIRPSGELFDRGGRCTILLTRSDPDAPWKAIHTHFSLIPVR